jgi:undecaprenyl diphosphate synthase
MIMVAISTSDTALKDLELIPDDSIHHEAPNISALAKDCCSGNSNTPFSIAQPQEQTRSQEQAPFQELPAAPQEGPFFSDDDLLSLNCGRKPRHVAIIPDANRRWAQAHCLPFVNGYLEGAQTLIRTALAAKEMGIPVVSVYSFSTENWKRPKDQIQMLMQLFDVHLNFYADSLVKADIRLQIIGDVAQLPLFLQKTIVEVTERTASGKSLDLVLAMNYGGRDELVRAFRKLAAMYRDENLKEISEETVSEALDTHHLPDPDLVIRTGGEERLSNFLLWQSFYAEVYTDPAQWPDFSPHHFLRAILAYQSRTRRYGGN